MTQTSRRIAAVVVSVVLAIGAVAITFYATQTYHYAVVQPGVLYRDGNRGVRELAHACGRADAKTVVSLIDDRELNDPKKPQFKAEADYLSQHGIAPVRIAVPLGGYPSADDVRSFLAIVADPTKRPVLVHCAQGVRRTGMFVAAYQRKVLGFSAVEAKAAVKTFGHSAAIAADIDRFIDAYDPSTGDLNPLPTTRSTAE